MVSDLGLPLVSPKDLTLSIAFPATIRGRFTGDRLPTHSNNDSKLLYAIGTVLTKGLGIPAPRLLKAVSQHDTASELHAALHATWPTNTATGNPSPNRAAFLEHLGTAISTDSDIDTALLSTPSNEPACNCHDQWSDYLNPSTDTMSSAVSPTGTRHIFRLAFNSSLVAEAVAAHLNRYLSLLRPTGVSFTPAELTTMDPWQRTWVTAAVRSNAIHTVATVAVYGIRYETTLLNGWKRGPDHHLAPGESAHFNQLYGDDNRFAAFLNRAAPNCFPRSFSTLANGDGSIQFIHEAQHRNELFRLQGASSPSHGITVPLSLEFKQLHRPTSHCCSVCGKPDHTAHACPLRGHSKEAAPDDGKMETDAVPLRDKEVVCRLCYSTAHQSTCNTAYADRTCLICGEMGHTSFHCASYKAFWVPLSVPLSTRPPNPRPSALIAYQRGLPAVSWSTMAAGNATAASHQPPSASDYHTAFPALSQVPASPTDTASTPSPRSAPPSPLTPPAPQPSAELAELKAMVALQQQSLQRLQASLEAQQAANQQMMQAQQAVNQQTMQRFDALLALFTQLLPAPVKPVTPSGMNLEPAPLHAPSPITAYMQHEEKKSPTVDHIPPACCSPPPATPLPYSLTLCAGSLPGAVGAFSTFTTHAANTFNAGGVPSAPPRRRIPPAYSAPPATASSHPLHQ